MKILKNLNLIILFLILSLSIFLNSYIFIFGVNFNINIFLNIFLNLLLIIGIIILLIRKEKIFILVSSLISIILLGIIITFFYSFFIKDRIVVENVLDNNLKTKYQDSNNNERNIYYSLVDLYDHFPENKKIFGELKKEKWNLDTSLEYRKILEEKNKLYECFALKNKKLCSGEEINEFLKDKNYESIIKSGDLNIKILKIINKNLYYKNSGYSGIYLKNINTDLKNNFYYLINGTNKYEYLNQYYKLLFTILNGDLNISDLLSTINSINILNNQIKFLIKNNYLDKKEIQNLNNILKNYYKNTDTKSIFENVIKVEYKQIIERLPDIDDNILYNRNYTIEILKNIYYLGIIKNNLDLNTKIDKSNLLYAAKYNGVGRIFVSQYNLDYSKYKEKLEKINNEIKNLLSELN